MASPRQTAFMAECIWSNDHVRKSTIIRVCIAMTITTLLYGSVTHTFISMTCDFYGASLKAFISWPTSNGKTASHHVVLEQIEIAKIESMLLRFQLSWAGHVYHLEDIQKPIVALCWGTTCRSQRQSSADSQYAVPGAYHVVPPQLVDDPHKS